MKISCPGHPPGQLACIYPEWECVKTMKGRSENSNIILTGFMGTGKTEVGKRLAEQLDFSYVDTDDIIEDMAKKPIPAIFAEDGEPHFRELETKAIRSVQKLQRFVVATGGGAVIREENIKAMRKGGPIVCLTATPGVIFDRVKDDTYRPLLQMQDPMKKIHDLLAQRQAQYSKADIMIDTSPMNVEEVVEALLQILDVNTSGEGQF